jgi:hypothetical protein
MVADDWGARSIPPPPILRNAPHRVGGVAEADLLAGVVAAAVVVDGHLHDAVAEPRDLRRDLGLETEAVLLDVDLLDDLAAEEFSRFPCR